MTAVLYSSQSRFRNKKYLKMHLSGVISHPGPHTEVMKVWRQHNCNIQIAMKQTNLLNAKLKTFFLRKRKNKCILAKKKTKSNIVMCSDALGTQEI